MGFNDSCCCYKILEQQLGAVQGLARNNMTDTSLKLVQRCCSIAESRCSVMKL